MHPHRSRTAVILALVVAALALSTGREARAQSFTAGAIQGVITDAVSGEPLAGVTVIAESPALQGQQAAITDDSGAYKLTNLPPGAYVLTYTYLSVTVRRPEIEVSADKTTPAYAKINTAEASTEVITVEGHAPPIDPTSTTQGVTLDQDYTRNMPVGRTYGDNLKAAAGASSDDKGAQFSGSSSLENQYIVDGSNTTTLRYGQLGSPIVNEFIQQTELITGGYNAEYGRSTGGVVNVVTKSGSNELHGSIFGYASPGFLVAAAQATPSASASIDAQTNLMIDSDFGFELGGPIIKDKLWFYAGLAPQISRSHLDRITRRRVDRNGDGEPDTDPATGFLTSEELDRTRLTARADSYPFIGKLNFAAAPEHQGQVSIVGTPSRGNDLGTQGLPAATHLAYQQLTTDVAAKWTSKFNDNKTEVEALVGWHQSAFEQTALDPLAAGLPRQNLFYGDLGTWGQLGGESQKTIAGCTDGGASDPYPMIRNCPDEGEGYAIGGAGDLANYKEERRTARLSVIERLVGLGHHEIKAGIDVEDNQLRTRRQHSGDMYFDVQLPHADAIGQTYQYRYVKLGPVGNPDNLPQQCPDTDNGSNLPCDFVGPVDVLGQTLNWAGYLRDSWQVLPNLTLNLGARYEEQRMRYAKALQNTVDPFTGDYRGTNAMELTGMWAPRLGVVYDWTNTGRSKLYGSWGRFFESVPMDLNMVNFGGETTFRRIYQMDQCGQAVPGVGAPDGPSCVAAGNASMGSNVYGSGVLIAPGTKAQYLDEALLGVEYAVTEDLKVGLGYHDRRLGRVLEDVSPDNTVTYILSNPGEWDPAEEQKLVDQIARTADPAEQARLGHELDLYRGIRKYDRPKRVYQAVEVSASQRVGHRMLVQASYTYARNQGNFPGLYAPESGAINPNITAQYDLVELLANRNGPLPNDRPHAVRVEGYYTYALGKLNQLTGGARFRAASGTPIDTLGSNSIYGFGESFVLQRGVVGRTQYDVGLDLHLSYGIDLGSGTRLEAFTDLFNVFDRQGADTVDQTYTRDNVSPIAGGGADDVVWARALDSNGNEPDHPRPAARNPNFRNASTRATPFAARFGARFTF